MPTSLKSRLQEGVQAQDALVAQHTMLSIATERHLRRMQKAAGERAETLSITASEMAASAARTGGPLGAGMALAGYLVDASQRAALTLDALRKRGDIFVEHEEAGAPPVLVYDYQVVVDGRELPRPCNYMLLAITPPAGVETHAWKRPYVIIDPRAGHGPGIGGFKPESQVGVALGDGHPVYFVAFRQVPEPSQTLADVAHAEAAFLREVIRRHPDAPNPVIVGNCQGGWAGAILAATNPDISGPLVLNGAPMAYWSGRLGQDPMRYAGGVLGGVLPTLLASDLAGGHFDGAHLVQNFEALNPGRTWFRKYYDLFARIDEEEEHFLQFEKWWGGYVLLNGAEIRWIVENLFIGNRLSKNEARLEVGRPIDLKQIRAPVIVFASHGDNITPPQQALNWIADTYADEREIEIRGQRIIYMVHEQVGHLGIFVSSSVAQREHSQMASTMKTIEALPPGLFEMRIEDVSGHGADKRFTVSFAKRTMADIGRLGDGRAEEAGFAAVARLSEMLAECYDATLRPAVQAISSPAQGEAARAMHPLRAQRRLFSSANPMMAPAALAADRARAQRRRAPVDNPFLLAERLWAQMVEESWNIVRDWRAMFYETMFLATFASPWAVHYGRPQAERRTLKSLDELRALPEVVSALGRIGLGGLAEAVVRMLVLLADTRSEVRRDRLQRSSEVLATREPFTLLAPAERSRLIHEQTLIAHFEPEAALAALPAIITSDEDRAKALAMATYILGAVEDMEPRTRERLDEICDVLDQPRVTARPASARA